MSMPRRDPRHDGISAASSLPSFRWIFSLRGENAPSGIHSFRAGLASRRARLHGCTCAVSTDCRFSKCTKSTAEPSILPRFRGCEAPSPDFRSLGQLRTLTHYLAAFFGEALFLKFLGRADHDEGLGIAPPRAVSSWQPGAGSIHTTTAPPLTGEPAHGLPKDPRPNSEMSAAATPSACSLRLWRSGVARTFQDGSLPWTAAQQQRSEGRRARASHPKTRPRGP